jgi:hypothetical protein
MHGENVLHAAAGAIGVTQQAGAIGEAEQFGQMRQRAGALLSADHDKMILQTVEIGHEDDAGFVKARWRLENVAR